MRAWPHRKRKPERLVERSKGQSPGQEKPHVKCWSGSGPIPAGLKLNGAGLVSLQPGNNRAGKHPKSCTHARPPPPARQRSSARRRWPLAPGLALRAAPGHTPPWLCRRVTGERYVVVSCRGECWGGVSLRSCSIDCPRALQLWRC